MRSDGKNPGFRKFSPVSMRMTDGTDDHTVNACSRINPAGAISMFSGTTCNDAPPSQDANISNTDTSKDVSENCPTRSSGQKWYCSRMQLRKCATLLADKTTPLGTPVVP